MVTRGHWATVYVNDQRIWTFRGFPPTGPSQLGLRGSSGSQPCTWQFSDLIVRQTDLSLLLATPATLDSSLLYEVTSRPSMPAGARPATKCGLSGTR